MPTLVVGVGSALTTLMRDSGFITFSVSSALFFRARSIRQLTSCLALLVFVVAFVDLVLYSIIAIYLAIQARRTTAKIPLNISNLSGVSKIMFLYSISYIVTILPLSAYRVASMAGHKWSTDAQLAAGFIFTLSGFVNCCIYATTRNIISSESVGAIRRGSRQSGTISGLAQGESRFFESFSEKTRKLISFVRLSIR